MQVGDVCTHESVTVAMDDNVLHAAQIMRERHVGSVIAVDKSSGRMPAGILTDRDIVVSVVAEGAKDLRRTPVADAMTKSIVIAREDDDVDEIINNMATNGIRRVPVVDDDDTLVGVLAFDDLVAFMSGRMETLFSLISYEIDKEITRDLP